MSAISKLQGPSATNKTIGGTARRCVYRRSSTCKAPRKRTFLASMQSGDVAARVAFQADQAVLVMAPASACLGGGDCGNAGKGNNGRKGGNGGSGPFGRSDEPAPGADFNWLAVAVGATALVAVASAAPSPAFAFASLTAGGLQRLASASRTRSEAPRARPASRSVWKTLPNGATLVVPVTPATAAAGQLEGRVVESRVQLSDRECRMIANSTRQFNVKEAVRV